MGNNCAGKRVAYMYSRRRVWATLLLEAVVSFGTLKGGQGASLSELGSLPDEELAQLTPLINPDYAILVDQGYVWSQHRRRCEERARLFPTEQEYLTAFNLFNGRTSLGSASRQVAIELGCDHDKAFAFVRSLFLFLASKLVCVPSNPPSMDE